MGVCLPHPEHLSPCASPSLHKARAQNSLKPQRPTRSGSGPKMGQEPAVRVSRTQQERGKGWTASWCFERMRACSSCGGWGAGPQPNRPLTLEPLGLQASLPHSPSHLQTTLVFTQPVCPTAAGGGGRRGFVATGPKPDPSPPRRTSPQCLRPPLSVAAKTFSQQVFRESRQQRPALNIKVFQRSKKKERYFGNT